MKDLTREDEAAYSEMMSRIYQHCLGNAGDPFGTAYMTWDMDFRARAFAVQRSSGATPRRLLRWTFEPHMNARQDPVGARFGFHFEEGDETYFLGEPVSFKGLQAYLSGNEFERVFPPASQLIAAAEWDAWGRGTTAAIALHYEEFIYPRVAETVSAIAARAPDRRLCVVDLGGGTGRLAEVVCDGVDRVSRVVVVERSKPLLALAEARALGHPGRLVTRSADLTSTDVVDSLDVTPDIIILCGVVAQQVMEHGQGLRLMRACQRRLPVGGFALVPSYSPALLTSREYESMGFEVHNKTLHVVEETPRGSTLRTNDFYVLETIALEGGPARAAD
jgi:hypothetical protein